MPPLMTGQVLATPLPFTCRYVRPCRGTGLLNALLPDLSLRAEPQKGVRQPHLQLVVGEGLRSLQGTAGRLSQHGNLCERSWAQTRCCFTAMAADLTPAISADKPRVAASWPAFCATSRRGAAWHTTCLLAFLQT